MNCERRRKEVVCGYRRGRWKSIVKGMGPPKRGGRSLLAPLCPSKYHTWKWGIDNDRKRAAIGESGWAGLRGSPRSEGDNADGS